MASAPVPTHFTNHIRTQTPDSLLNHQIETTEEESSTPQNTYLQSDANPGPASTLSQRQHNPVQSTSISLNDSLDLSIRGSSDPPETDLDGHYVGPSSGVSFLLRVQKRLQEHQPVLESNSIFTFGDSKLPSIDPAFLVLPLRADAESLVARFFEFAFPTHRFLHQPTIEQWMKDFYDHWPNAPQSKGTKDRQGLILMVMAQAAVYPIHGESQSVDQNNASAIPFI